MRPSDGASVRVVKAVHGAQRESVDPAFERDLAADLRARLSREELGELFRRFSRKDAYLDTLMRRVCLRALVKSLGDGLAIKPNVGFIHPETFEIGEHVFIGEQTIIQGRYDGRCIIGSGTWIGPQSYFDARDLMIGESVGWGPGAKVLGSEHTGVPLDAPIIATDLRIASVRVGDGADIGVNAILMPGVTVGRGSIVGAGAVVTRDVPAFAKVAGAPAKVIGWRTKDDEAVGAGQDKGE